MSNHVIHRPHYAVIFYREMPARPRIFRFRRWDTALDAADRFSERLGAVAVIQEMPVNLFAR